MVMVRNPDSTAYDSMPNHAIATGYVDAILEPSAMPAAIEEYMKHDTEPESLQLQDEKNIKLVIGLINRNTPLDFTDYKPTTILRRTKRRAALMGFASLEKYLTFLRTEEEELVKLSREFLISVSSFFRDKKAFAIIASKILPDIISRLGPDEELKFWVAGCAKGHEAYSFAILIAEELSQKQDGRMVKIFATDVDNSALQYAGKGIYEKEIAQDISPLLLSRYFTEEGKGYRINSSIRKMVIFAKHDMVKNPPYCNMHFISCRNVLIYMAPVLQQKIFTMLLFGLKLNGYLFLGTSENPHPIQNQLEVIDKQWKIFRNLQSKKTINIDSFMLPQYLNKVGVPALPHQVQGSINQAYTLAEAIQQDLAHKLDYFVVCLNQDDTVVTSFGDATKFLIQRHFTTHLPDLLSRPLGIAFSILKKKNNHSHETEHLNGIENGSEQFPDLRVDLSFCSLKAKGQKGLFLAIFKEHDDRGVKTTNVPLFQSSTLNDYVDNLEEELKEQKANLDTLHEQLNISHEHMQSFNEELIAANEEMQSTNEEMQSVNEELHTINSDYQRKNKELIELNDDLNNYFRSNINGQLFIDDNLVLVKFSPGTVKLINLQESDIGRPLSDIATNIKLDTLVEDARKVLLDGFVMSKEIETNNGKWYQVMIMPYLRSAKHLRDGAILTFNDITELKLIQYQLDISNKLLNSTIESASMGTWSLDLQTQEYLPSDRLKELYCCQAENMSYETSLTLIADEHRAMVAASTEACIVAGKPFSVEFALKEICEGKVCWLGATGNVTHDTMNKARYFTGVAQDISDKKLGELLKEDLLAMASHELKTPLTLIQTYTEILQEQVVMQEVIEVDLFSKTIAQLKKVGKLINGFLQDSSVENGKIYLVEQFFEINKLIEETIEEVLLTEKGIDILFVPHIELYLTADRDKVSQVISNLLNNAIKYSPSGKDIIVTLNKMGDMVEVSVVDEGLGINNKFIPQLFDRHYRIENVSTKNITGFGLGLYLAAEIVKKNKGKIWVKSIEGKGSTFSFSLPLYKNAQSI